jgi:hypothetical protein
MAGGLLSCYRKKPFKTKEKAEEWIEELKKAPDCRRPTRLKAWKCGLCGKWHVGHH